MVTKCREVKLVLWSLSWVYPMKRVHGVHQTATTWQTKQSSLHPAIKETYEPSWKSATRERWLACIPTNNQTVWEWWYQISKVGHATVTNGPGHTQHTIHTVSICSILHKSTCSKGPLPFNQKTKNRQVLNHRKPRVYTTCRSFDSLFAQLHLFHSRSLTPFQSNSPQSLQQTSLHLQHQSVPFLVDRWHDGHGSRPCSEAAVAHGPCGPAPSKTPPGPRENHQCYTALHVVHQEITTLQKQWCLVQGMNKSAHQMPQKKSARFKIFPKQIAWSQNFSPSCRKDPHCSSSAETSHRTGPNFPERAATLPPQWSTTLRGTSPEGDHTNPFEAEIKTDSPTGKQKLVASKSKPQSLSWWFDSLALLL